VKPVLVFGGYGTFGAHVARELARTGHAVTIAGRDRGKAEAAARALGPQHRGLGADVTDRESCRAALAGQAVATSCAGPFSALGEALLHECLAARCHYVDIADDRAHAARVRGWGERFREARLTAAYGCSSLPGLSGALALLAREGEAAAPRVARVTLFIGNANPKGVAAVRSAAEVIGRPITAPQGTVRGFADPETVRLPPPFGRRTVYNFDGAEYDLFPTLLGVSSVAVKVGFELPGAGVAFAALGALPARHRGRAARMLIALGSPTRILGHSGGAVMVELAWPDGSSRRAGLACAEDGQRMAALPCALAAAALASGECSLPGAATAYELLGYRELLQAMAASGFPVTDA
jgi:NAD(P)-dependent dehydrogenase (short-subunit alcohol dehydrogenase family)